MANDSPELPTDYVLGLDLGQARDFTALAVMERTYGPAAEGQPVALARYGVRGLQRWPRGTSYTVIVPAVVDLVGRAPLRNSLLAVDQTGVGSAVVDMLRQARPQAAVHPVCITAGQAVGGQAGVWRVPKKELVSCLQVLLQTRRLQIGAGPLQAQLADELLAFRVKVSSAGHETFEAERERDHDDLVMAVALGCWLGERVPPPYRGPLFLYPDPTQDEAGIRLLYESDDGDRQVFRIHGQEVVFDDRETRDAWARR
jgi:hypothetical protein